MREDWVRLALGAFVVAACGGAIDVGSNEPSTSGVGGTNNPFAPSAPAQGGSRSGLGSGSAGKSGNSMGKPVAGASSAGGAPAEPSTAGAPADPATAGAADDLGEFSFGGAPTYLDACVSDLAHVLPRPDFECPPDMVNDQTPCDAPENAGCVWQLPDAYNQDGGYGIANCYLTPTGTRWRNYVMSGGLGPIGVNHQNCPDWVPTFGSACDGHVGEICYYPGASCSCGAGGGGWSCELDPGTEGNPPDLGLPAEVARLCPPEGVDESKQVNELSEAEILAWCHWQGDPSGEPRPAVFDDVRDTSDYATKGMNVGYIACLPELPVELCLRNFHAVRECTATLGDVDDCVETIRGVVDYHAWVGHGCAPLLANPTCQGLAVSEDCVLPLD